MILSRAGVRKFCQVQLKICHCGINLNFLPRVIYKNSAGMRHNSGLGKISVPQGSIVKILLFGMFSTTMVITKMLTSYTTACKIML